MNTGRDSGKAHAEQQPASRTGAQKPRLSGLFELPRGRASHGEASGSAAGNRYSRGHAVGPVPSVPGRASSETRVFRRAVLPVPDDPPGARLLPKAACFCRGAGSPPKILFHRKKRPPFGVGSPPAKEPPCSRRGLSASATRSTTESDAHNRPHVQQAGPPCKAQPRNRSSAPSCREAWGAAWRRPQPPATRPFPGKASPLSGTLRRFRRQPQERRSADMHRPGREAALPRFPVDSLQAESPKKIHRFRRNCPRKRTFSGAFPSGSGSPIPLPKRACSPPRNRSAPRMCFFRTSVFSRSKKIFIYFEWMHILSPKMGSPPAGTRSHVPHFHMSTALKIRQSRIHYDYVDNQKVFRFRTTTCLPSCSVCNKWRLSTRKIVFLGSNKECFSFNNVNSLKKTLTETHILLLA